MVVKNFYRTSESVLKRNFSKLSLLSSVIYETTVSRLISYQFETSFKTDQFKEEDYKNASSNFCPTFDEITNFC